MASLHPDASRRSNRYPIPERMKAWVLGGPEELSLVEKPVPYPGAAEVLVITCHADSPLVDGCGGGPVVSA